LEELTPDMRKTLIEYRDTFEKGGKDAINKMLKK
jgi:hypothetical protein